MMEVARGVSFCLVCLLMSNLEIGNACGSSVSVCCLDLALGCLMLLVVVMCVYVSKVDLSY